MKVLILTSRFGQGHGSVAEALREEYAAQGCETVVLDAVAAAHPRLYPLIYRVFGGVICRCAPLYNLLNAIGRRGGERRPSRRLRALCGRLAPDAVVTTWSAAAAMLGEIGAPLFVCVTDLSAHRGWVWPQARGYLVACRDVAERLAALGADPARIEVCGLPVRRAFLRAARAGDFAGHVLITGGGLGICPWIGAALRSLRDCPGLEVTVVAGRNERLRRWLEREHPEVRAVGYTQEMPRWLAWADIVVSKPGGVSLCESLAVGTPFLAVAPAYAHERENDAFLRRHGAGLTAARGAEVGPLIAALAARPEEYARLRAATERLRAEIAAQAEGGVRRHVSAD